MLNQTKWTDIYAPNGEFAKLGQVIKNPALSRTLQTIAAEGPDAFYTVNSIPSLKSKYKLTQ